MAYYTKHIFVCTNQKPAGKQCCADAGGVDYFEYLKSRLKELGCSGPGKIRVSKSGCLGRCDTGPWIVIYPEGRWINYSSFAELDKIIDDLTC